MTDCLEYNANDQGEIAKAASELFSALEHSLPRVPWFSNSGQRDVFHKIVESITESASRLNADDSAQKAVIFWTLTILYSNSRSFRLATASIKNWGGYGIPPVASTFVSWIGDNTDPGQIIATYMESWKE